MISTPAAVSRKTIRTETAEGACGGLRNRMEDIAPGFGQVDPSHGRAHPGTSAQRACFVARTSQSPPRLLPEEKGECEATGLSRLQSTAKAAACSMPGDEFHGAAIDLLNAEVYFLPPGFFRAFVDCWIEALDQRVD